MNTLIRLEIRRFWARKLVRNGAMSLTVPILVFGGSQYFTHSSEAPSTEGVAAQVERDVEECRMWALEEWESISVEGLGEPGFDEPGFDEYLAQFESAEEWANEQCNPMYFQGYVQEGRFCFAHLWHERYLQSELCPDIDQRLFGFQGDQIEEMASVTIDEEPKQTFMYNGKRYRHPVGPNMGAVVNTSTSLLIVAIVLGASFVGAEYRAGTIENQLLWETRRNRIVVAKFLAVGSSAALLHLVALLFLVFSVVPAAMFVGTFAGVDSAFWAGVVSTIIRGMLSAGMVAVASAALALVVRNTAGSVGVMMGYGIVGTGLLFWLLPTVTRWEIATNSSAFVTGGDVSRYLSDRAPRAFGHGPWAAGAIVFAYMIALALMAGAVFNRRDIH